MRQRSVEAVQATDSPPQQKETEEAGHGIVDLVHVHKLLETGQQPLGVRPAKRNRATSK
jgi:hypothetical protein